MIRYNNIIIALCAYKFVYEISIIHKNKFIKNAEWYTGLMIQVS